MDARVNREQQMTGLGVILMFVFVLLPWLGEGASGSGWAGQPSTDVYLVITALVAAAAALGAGRGALFPGLTMNGAAALLAGAATVLLLRLSFLDLPAGAALRVGAYLGLVAAAVIAFGGYRAAQDDASGAGGRAPRRRRRSPSR